MVIHCSLLIIESLAALAYNTPPVRFPKISMIVYISLPLIDIFLQLLICYICWTVGAHEHLKRFDCLLIDDGNGNYTLKYRLKANVPATVGLPYATTNAADVESSSSLKSDDDSAKNSFTQNESIWRNRNRRDMSFEN